MRNECHRDGMIAHRGIRWLTGNIRRKLTLFVVVILLMVVGMFWFFSIYRLEPTYEESIKQELGASLGEIVLILDNAYDGGEALLVTVEHPGGGVTYALSAEFEARLQEGISAGRINLTGRCLDIGDANYSNVWLKDNLQPRCFLHPSVESGINDMGQIVVGYERNGDYVRMTRLAVLESGGKTYEKSESGLFIMGRLAAGGNLSVILTTSLERIPQAVSVLKQLLLPLSIILGLFATAMAWVFSHWFTRPLARLSAAAKEMARGNYTVRVDDCGDDEIGELAKDFNQMAFEVGRSAELQRDLLANVSHDLRTPLTLIKGYAETVRDLSGEDPVKRTEQLNVIVDESDRLSHLVGRVMELSRVASGAERPEPLRFDLNDLCDELAYRYDEICRQQGNTFLFSGEEGCNVYADPGLTERALHNLLGNAMHHVGADGFVGLKVYRPQYGIVRCEVSDHGPGVDDADLPHIFDRYYRSRADAGRPGTGLGLSITKAIFENQGIRYGVITEKGKGTTFWFELPLVE